MKNNKEKIKQLLIYLLIFIIGFGIGMTFTFRSVINIFKEYNVNIRDFI